MKSLKIPFLILSVFYSVNGVGAGLHSFVHLSQSPYFSLGVSDCDAKETDNICQNWMHIKDYWSYFQKTLPLFHEYGNMAPISKVRWLLPKAAHDCYVSQWKVVPVFFPIVASASQSNFESVCPGYTQYGFVVYMQNGKVYGSKVFPRKIIRQTNAKMLGKYFIDSIELEEVLFKSVGDSGFLVEALERKEKPYEFIIDEKPSGLIGKRYYKEEQEFQCYRVSVKFFFTNPIDRKPYCVNSSLKNVVWVVSKTDPEIKGFHRNWQPY